MTNSIPRRTFLTTSAVSLGIGTAFAWAEEPEAKSANDTITIGMMGVNGRGRDLANGFLKQPNCKIAYVCDVDSRARERAIDLIDKAGGGKPKAEGDFRKVLDDKSVDVLVVAAPDHWHGPATIAACNAGKHVYCEKPACHNPQEGEWMVAAAQKHKRVVQVGTQRRSFPAIIEAINLVRGGALGKVHYSRGWYNNRRPSIGHGVAGNPPAHLDFALWQGPAPTRPFRDNILHYNWHWFWHWGTGELGNNGVHAIDVCRWGLNVSFPQKVTSAGQKVRHDDDQETPDTHVVNYEFPGGKSITWEGLSWSPRGIEGDSFGMTFHGTEATMAVTSNGYKIYDLKNKLTSENPGTGGDAAHLANFLSCIRNDRLPNATIEEAYRSTLLCNLGNIAHRAGRVLKIDPQNGHILDDREAQALWRREYQTGFEPVV